jgi:integrase/recombinase XerD
MITGAVRKSKRYPAEPFTSPEVRLLLSKCSTTALGLRLRAAIALLAYSGLRVGSLIHVRPVDICLATGTCRVLVAKGDRPYTAAIPPIGVREIAPWLEWRLDHGLPMDGRLISTLRSQPIATGAIRTALKRLGKRAGIHKRCTPHNLRHGYAAIVGRQVHLEELRILLNHQSLATTAIYLSSLGGSAISAAHACHF